MSVTPRDSSHTAKTVLRQINEVQQAFPAAQYSFRPETTLNHKYGVQNRVNADIIPSLAYFGIGIGGAYNSNDAALVTAHTPRPIEMDLFQPIPFRCVPVDEDLSDAERKAYRMRVRRDINGQAYFCYYLKLLALKDNTAQITRVDPLTKEELPYELQSKYLTPTPVIPSTDGTQNTNVIDVNVSLRLAMNITGAEVLESINVLFGGDLRYARLSEYGIYSGVDKLVNGYDANNVVMTYTEAIYTQLAYKTCTTGSAVENASWSAERILCLGDGNLLTLNS